MTRYNVWLDHRSLSGIDPSICITDVQEQPPQLAFTAASLAGGHGQRIVKRTRQSISVLVRFAVRQRDPISRRAILQRIVQWAAPGGMLAVSHRPSQQLLVDDVRLPDDLSALRWTEEVTLTFTAFLDPFWQQAYPVTATQQLPRLLPPGDAPVCPLDVTWQHADTAAAVTLTIQTPLSAITFRQLPIAAGETLLIRHDRGFLEATVNGADALPYRTALSSDDLLLPCGQTSQVAITTEEGVTHTCTLSARGRWL